MVNDVSLRISPSTKSARPARSGGATITAFEAETTIKPEPSEATELSSAFD